MILKLTQNKETIVDEDNYQLLSLFSWQAQAAGNDTFYAAGRLYGKKIYLHRFIMNVDDPTLFVDHINGNKLDNRKSNLRICSNKENSRNRPKSKNTTSQYKGVNFRKHHKIRQWEAAIECDYQYRYLGSFYTEIEAAKAYNEAAIKHYGEFARLNEI